jgi:hypothetical protein
MERKQAEAKKDKKIQNAFLITATDHFVKLFQWLCAKT